MTDLCKLTGERGKFVRSHLIPAALTEAGGPDGPLYQHGQGERPVRRWTSWYDDRLVIDAGEKILADYDDWAIRELRKHKLAWSSWGPMIRLSTVDHSLLPFPLDARWGMREIKLTDSKRLRLFLLSVLWRAAETGRFEFNETQIFRAFFQSSSYKFRVWVFVTTLARWPKKRFYRLLAMMDPQRFPSFASILMD